MSSKYIVFKSERGTEFGVIFPEFLIHKQVADSICGHIRRSDGKSVAPIAAGFVNVALDRGIFCNGDSESLALELRDDAPERDVHREGVAARAVPVLVRAGISEGDPRRPGSGASRRAGHERHVSRSRAMTLVDPQVLMRRAHVRGSIEAWTALEKARGALLATWKNAYVDHDVVLSLCEDIAAEQDRLVSLRGEQPQ